MSFGSAIVSFFTVIWHALDALRKVLHLIVLLFLFLAILVAMSSSIPIVPHRAALVLDLKGRIVEQLTGDPFDRAVGKATGRVEDETRLRDVVDVIDAAAKDSRIKMMVLDLGEMSGGGLSKMQEIGAALTRFRKTGKKVVATGVNYEQPQYYVAAHADEVYLDPLGVVFIDGYDYYRIFLREAIDKLAV